MKNEAQVIRNFKDLENKNGQSVTLEGIYTLYYPFPEQKGKSDEFVVHIILNDEEGIFLEPYWSENARRSKKEVETFQNKKVKVSGVYHEQQPKQPGAPDYASSFGGSCVSPVTTISLAE